MSVDRCICHDVTLAEIKSVAVSIRAELGDCGEDEMIERLCDREGCGTVCGLCKPYVKLMLRTGRTEFEVLTSEEWAALQPTGG